MSRACSIPDDPVARGLADRRRAGRAVADGGRVHQEGDRRRAAAGAAGGAERAAADRRPGRGPRGAAATGGRGARPPRRSDRRRGRAAPTGRPIPPPSRRRGSATGARRRGRAGRRAPATPAPLLRTRETANDVEAAKKVQEVLRRAEQNLAKVNYRGLSANGRKAGRHRPPVHHPGGRRPREAPARLRAVPGRQGRSRSPTALRQPLAVEPQPEPAVERPILRSP